MTPEIYESKRNDLISMLDSILTTATGLSAPARKELEETAAKLKRNSFEIVLVGEFQGGKSTTFDTICDGREISPRGIGIKTSACKISAQSVPADLPERADLTWKSDEELMLTMIGIVRDNLVNDKDAYALFTKKDKNGIDVLPSLSDPHIHQLASKAIHAEWERYNANMANYDPDQRGLLDLLKISTLILDFCNSPELAKLKAKTTVTIDELKPLVVFPQEWEERWLNGENAQWTFSEIPFVFLGSVFCHIHCANLERLGCVITDCPGLFAGPWDTAVAQKAMMQADAILYLIGGQRAVTEADLRALTEIRKTQQGHKVFFAINARLSKANIAGPIRQADFSMIRQRGYEIDNAKTIDVFNSLLAFGAKAEKPTDEKVEKIRKRELTQAIGTYFSLDLTDDDDIKRAKELRENRPELYKASDFPSILAKIETDVVTKKFKSILVNGGTSKASAALDALNGDLIQKESVAAKEFAKIENEIVAARTKLEEFQSFVTQTVSDELSDERAANQTAGDYFQSVFRNNLEDLADALTFAIVNEFKTNDKIQKLGWQLVKSKIPIIGTSIDRDESQRLAEDVFKDPAIGALKSIIGPATKGWLATLREGQNEMFNLAYGRTADRLAATIREKWNASYRTNEGFLQGLEPTVDLEMSSISGNHTATVVGAMDIEGEALSLMWGKLLARILTPIVAIVAVLLIEIILLVAGGVIVSGGAEIIALILAGGSFYAFMMNHMEKKMTAKLRPAIREKLDDMFASEEYKSSMIESFKSTILKDIVSELRKRYQDSLNVQLEAFNRRVNETLEMKEIGQAEKDRIAAEAKKVREEQIEPARKRIAEFHKGLEPFFESEPKQEA